MASRLASYIIPHLTGDAEPTTVCVTGGLVRGLHPCESLTAARLKRALDELREEEGDAVQAAVQPAAAAEAAESGELREEEGEAAAPEAASQAAAHPAQAAAAPTAAPTAARAAAPAAAEPTPTPTPSPKTTVDHDLRGFRLLRRCGFGEALEEALRQARAG